MCLAVSAVTPILVEARIAGAAVQALGEPGRWS